MVNCSRNFAKRLEGYVLAFFPGVLDQERHHDERNRVCQRTQIKCTKGRSVIKCWSIPQSRPLINTHSTLHWHLIWYLIHTSSRSIVSCQNLTNCSLMPMKWNFCLLFYFKILKSMILWFIIFEFGLRTSAYNFFSSFKVMVKSSHNVPHSVCVQNMQISTVDVIRCVKPSSHHSIWEE